MKRLYNDKIMKKRIIFVDDEVEVILGLRRMLRDMRKEWTMEFAESGQKALDIMAKTEFDVIVSDMRMPGMDGAQLLEHVVKKYPHIVRIVLSGHSKKEMIYKSVGMAHQYLTKPCNPEVLKSTIERACSLRELLANENLQRAVTKLHKLPSLPSLYIEINNELKSPDSSLTKVGEIISKDVSMTAKILQMVNSPFFGFFNEITSPSQAVTLLGLDTIRALVTSVHIFSKIKVPSIGKIKIEDLWQHFIVVGTVSKEIAKLELKDPKIIDAAFMAGMLHDIGKIVFFLNDLGRYTETIELADKESIHLCTAESRIFGTTHAEVGGYLLGIWGLPDSIIETIFFHHNPGISPEKEFGIITAVHVADALVGIEMPGYTVGELSVINYEHVKKIGKHKRLEMWKEKCREIIEKVRTHEREDSAG